ncbi:hypothetical protein CEXT_523471 [Caerostris extrusa]|uniref:Uncharacterized protein n=1 Tax=Caerostris extrusa TaxID=172846 RepID=A0AAV4SA68_CAEEX|nr:hypothetical protein CEXT_523471 [Caerostris extrusa]
MNAIMCHHPLLSASKYCCCWCQQSFFQPVFAKIEVLRKHQDLNRVRLTRRMLDIVFGKKALESELEFESEPFRIVLIRIILQNLL